MPYKIVDLTSVLTPARPYASRSTPVTYVAIHHTASPPNQEAKAIHDYHISKGWSGIGYHYLVRSVDEFGNLIVEKVRPTSVVPACVVGFNSSSICVAFVANFEENRPDPKVVDAAAAFVADLCRAFGLRSGDVKGHREFPNQNTSCPGRHFDLDGFRRAVWYHLHREGG